MKWITKEITPKDNNYELIFGVLVIPITAFIAIAASFLPKEIIPQCHFHQMTGYPCPTCGATRAIHLIATGHFLSAFIIQPLASIAIIVALLYSIYSFIVVIGNLPRLRLTETTVKERNIIFIAIVLLLILNWIYLIIKGI